MMIRLWQAADKLDKTIIVVIHDINFTSCWADQIVAIKDERIVAVGAPEQIIIENSLLEIFDVVESTIEVEDHQIAHFYLPAARRT